MDEQFLNEVWEHVATSLYAVNYWASTEVRLSGEPYTWIIKLREHNEESDGEPGEWFQLNRHELEKDLRALYDAATVMFWDKQRNGPQDWPAVAIAGIVAGDLTEWDDEIVDIFIQLSTLGEVTYG